MSRPDKRLDLEIAVHGDIGSPVATMKVIGEFDRLQVARFDESANVLPPALVLLTVDLTATTIIDSAALGSLVRLRQSLDNVDSRLEVIVSKPFQITVMRVGGLIEFLNVRVIDATEECTSDRRTTRDSGCDRDAGAWVE